MCVQVFVYWAWVVPDIRPLDAGCWQHELKGPKLNILNGMKNEILPNQNGNRKKRTKNSPPIFDTVTEDNLLVFVPKPKSTRSIRKRSEKTDNQNGTVQDFPVPFSSLLRVELDAVTKDRVHGLIEGHENALDKLVVVKEDEHNKGSGTSQSQGGSGTNSQGNGRAPGAGRKNAMES
jgi:hypothetical protein